MRTVDIERLIDDPPVDMRAGTAARTAGALEELNEGAESLPFCSAYARAA